MKLIPPLPNGEHILEYSIIRPLGQGGFGTTYLCKDRLLKRICVLKEYTPHHFAHRRSNAQVSPSSRNTASSYDSGKRNFLKEARRLAQFSHPNIARINRFFEENNTAYFVMDYVLGTSLDKLIGTRTNLFSESEIEAILLPICSGLEQLHGQGLIHRDIKPANILITSKGDPILIDFGAAVSVSDIELGIAEVIGTPSFAPPEQLDLSLPQGPWIDIYAIGATLYQLIAKRAPTPPQMRMNGAQLAPARELGRGLYGDKLLALTDHCLSLDFRERPQSINSLIKVFRRRDDDIFRQIIENASMKAVAHFLNFSEPNPGLRVDETVYFIAVFPIIDLSWRLGKGKRPKQIASNLLDTLSDHQLISYGAEFIQAGFTTNISALSKSAAHDRLEDYSSAYHLDRKNREVWTYDLTLQLCANNCLTQEASNETDQFKDLLVDIVDRMRGRVKKEYNKTLRNIDWYLTPSGWEKRIRVD